MYCNRFIILFTQIIHKKQTQKNIFNLTVQYLEKYSSAVQQLASSEEARRVTYWRRERWWGTVELKDNQH